MYSNDNTIKIITKTSQKGMYTHEKENYFMSDTCCDF